MVNEQSHTPADAHNWHPVRNVTQAHIERMRANFQADMAKLAALFPGRLESSQKELVASVQFVDQPDAQDVKALAYLLGADADPVLEVLVEQELLDIEAPPEEVIIFGSDESVPELHVKPALPIHFEELPDLPVGADTVNAAHIAFAAMYLEEGRISEGIIADPEIPLFWGADKTGDLESGQLIFDDTSSY